MNRREFLAGGASALGGAAAAAIAEKTSDGGLAPVSWASRETAARPVLPPGAHAADRFAAKCVGCGLCIAACPSTCLRLSSVPGRLGRVELDFRHGWCKPGCTRCGEVCPTGAIERVPYVDKPHVHVGRAVWSKDRCVRTVDGSDCHACVKHCPQRAVRLVKGFPVVDALLCTGCGACEHFCPARPQTAIRVEGYEVHRETRPMGEEDLLAEMRAVLSDGKACVVARRGVITSVAEGRGVKPLLDLLDADPNALREAIVLDRVTGRASAAICIVGGAAKVVSPVMVKGAKALLLKHGVAAEAGTLVPMLVNRKGTGNCPMDAATAKLDDPKAIVAKLRALICPQEN